MLAVCRGARYGCVQGCTVWLCAGCTVWLCAGCTVRLCAGVHSMAVAAAARAPIAPHLKATHPGQGNIEQHHVGEGGRVGDEVQGGLTTWL